MDVLIDGRVQEEKQNRTAMATHKSYSQKEILIVKMGEDQYLEGEGWGNWYPLTAVVVKQKQNKTKTMPDLTLKLLCSLSKLNKTLQEKFLQY